MKTVQKLSDTEMELMDVLEQMYQGSVKNMITALYDGEKLSEEDIAELKQ